METNVIVVAGAGGGIGSAIALAASDVGRLVLVDRDAASIERTVGSIPRERVLSTVAGDLREPGVRQQVCDTVRTHGAVSGFAFAAGIGPAQTDDAPEILDVGVRVPALLMQELKDLAAPQASFVLIGSVASRRAPKDQDDRLARATDPQWLNRWADDPPGAWEAYSLSKRGLVLAAEEAAVEWGAQGVRVNVVSPAQTATELGEATYRDRADIREFVSRFPIPRMAAPSEVSAAVMFLMGPSSSFITGVELLVDGGATAANVTMRPTPTPDTGAST